MIKTLVGTPDPEPDPVSSSTIVHFGNVASSGTVSSTLQIAVWSAQQEGSTSNG